MNIYLATDIYILKHILVNHSPYVVYKHLKNIK